MSELYKFIILTNLYAGNFEREMCAFMTGQTGECGVGSRYSEMFQGKYSVDQYDQMVDLIVTQPDDNGCYRPVTIYNEPDMKVRYSGVCIFMDVKPNSEQIALLKERAYEFANMKEAGVRVAEGLEILGFKLLKDTTQTQQEEMEVS